VSDALRWQSQGPSFSNDYFTNLQEEAQPLSPMSPGDQSRENRSGLPSETPAGQSFPEGDTETDLDSPINARSPRLDHENTYNTLQGPTTHQEYNFIESAASVLEATSLAAQRSRSRLRQNRSHSEALQPLSPTERIPSDAQPDNPPISASVQTETDSSALIPPLAQRRERRRVNISGKLVQGLQINGLPPIQEPPEEKLSLSKRLPDALSMPLNLNDGYYASKVRTRADTDPKLPITQQPSPKPIRRQASDTQLRSKASSLRSLNGARLSSGFSTSPSLSIEHVKSASRSNSPYLTFPIQRREIKSPPLTSTSALTSMLSKQPSSDGAENPFKYDYGALIVRGAGTDFLRLKIFFPNSKEQRNGRRSNWRQPVFLL